MAQQNPWEIDWSAPQAVPQAASGYIPGRVKQPTPLELSREARANEANDRANAAADRSAAAAARAADAANRQAQLDEKRLVKESQLTEGQAKDTNFYNAIVGAEREWRNVSHNPDTSAGSEAPGLAGDAVRSMLPRGWVNSMSSTPRQQANQAKENFIRATLRLESGAAIGDSEFYRQDQIFFPQTGDSPEVIEQKARARQQAINGFRIASGPGAEKVDKLYTLKTNDRGEVDLGQLAFNDQAPAQVSNAVNLTPEQEAEFRRLAQTGDPQALAQYAASLRLNIPQDQLEAGAKFYANPANRQVAPEVRVDNTIKPVDPGDNLAAVRGFADAATLGFADELGAIGNTVANGGTYADNLNRARGIKAFDEQNAGGQRFAGQLAGGAVLPSFGASGVRQLAGLGAAYGGAYGFGSANGDLGSRLAGAGGGAIAGGASGGALGWLGNAAATRLGNRPPPAGGGPELLEAATRQGVDVLPADVGGPMTRRFTSAAAQGPLSAGPIII